MTIERINPNQNIPLGYSRSVSSQGEKDISAEKNSEDKVEVGKNHQAPEETSKKKWTVLAYLVGKDNTLQRLAPSKMRQLELAGSDDNVDVVAQLSRQKYFTDSFSKDWVGTKRYHVEQNQSPPQMQEEMMNWFIPPYTKNITSPIITDLGEGVDAADPATVKDFLNWGIKNYPAEHYAIIFYSQGGGFAGSIHDAEKGSVIDNKEMGEILRDAAKTAGQKIDVVAFDGNLMAQAEVASEIKDSTNILVGSEGITGLGSIPLDAVLKDLRFELQDRDISPEELAKFFVLEAKYQPGPTATMMAPTYSAIDLGKFDKIKDAFKELGKELAHCLKIKPELKDALREDIKNTQSFMGGDAEPYQDYRDIVHFAETIKADEKFNNYNFPAIKNVTQALIDASKEVIIDNAHTGEAVKNAKGLSAYMPTDFGFDMASTFFDPPNFDPKHGYDKEIFAMETQWNDILSAIAKDTKMHEALRKIGLPDHAINKLGKIGEKGVKMGKFALSLATNAGHYEAYQAMKGKPPSSFMWIPGEIATKIGIAGGARQAFMGAGQVFEGIRNDTIKNRQTMIVDGSLDTATGAAVMATCVGMSFAQYAGVAKPAGIAAFAIPIAKMAYDMYNQMKGNIKGRAEMEAMSPEAKLKKFEADKRAEELKTEESPIYVSPIVKGITHIGSSGPISPDALNK